MGRSSVYFHQSGCGSGSASCSSLPGEASSLSLHAKPAVWVIRWASVICAFRGSGLANGPRARAARRPRLGRDLRTLRHRRAEHHRGERLAGRAQVVRRVAIEAEEILLEHQLAAPRHQQRVDQRGAAGRRIGLRSASAPARVSAASSMPTSPAARSPIHRRWPAASCRRRAATPGGAGKRCRLRGRAALELDHAAQTGQKTGSARAHERSFEPERGVGWAMNRTAAGPLDAELHGAAVISLFGIAERADRAPSSLRKILR